MSPLYFVVGILVVQRLAELFIARRNHRELVARGGIEVGRRHYPLLVALHAGWLLALLGTIDPGAPLSIPLFAVFVLLEGGRVWVLATLGPLWTTRVIVVPGGRRIRTGPYRYVNHPNYLIVCGEIAVVPLMFGAWQLAVIASVLNLLVLHTRIRVENKALAEIYGEPSPVPRR